MNNTIDRAGLYKVHYSVKDHRGYPSSYMVGIVAQSREEAYNQLKRKFGNMLNGYRLANEGDIHDIHLISDEIVNLIQAQFKQQYLRELQAAQDSRTEKPETDYSFTLPNGKKEK